MGHIHTKSGQHDFTASAFIIRTDFDEPKFLIHRHKTLGKYLQFGGHVELNETPWQAIIHELREEVGYDINQFKLLQPRNRLKKLKNSIVLPTPVVIDTHKYPIESDHYHTDISFVLITDEVPKLKPDDGESSDIQILSLREVKALEKETIGDVVEIAEYILNEVLDTWEAVDVAEFAS